MFFARLALAWCWTSFSQETSQFLNLITTKKNKKKNNAFIMKNIVQCILFMFLFFPCVFFLFLIFFFSVSYVFCRWHLPRVYKLHSRANGPLNLFSFVQKRKEKSNENKLYVRRWILTTFYFMNVECHRLLSISVLCVWVRVCNKNEEYSIFVFFGKVNGRAQ